MVNSKYFHCYATANDDKFYYRDFQNLLRIKNTSSGLHTTILYICISKVYKMSPADRIFTFIITRLFSKHPRIILREIIFKSNEGRDFSSFSKMKDLVIQEASLDDYVFFQNRSGYGPFRQNWLKEIIIQFEKFEKTAICGSTINFRDHPSRSNKNNLPHIQTYAFLTSVSYLQKLGIGFPGAEHISRFKIITEGEIGLSQFFLNKGYGITCMEWPEEFICNKSKPLNSIDIKDNVQQKHQFYHRSYFEKYENIKGKKMRKLDLIFCLIRNVFQ